MGNNTASMHDKVQYKKMRHQVTRERDSYNQLGFNRQQISDNDRIFAKFFFTPFQYFILFFCVILEIASYN